MTSLEKQLRKRAINARIRASKVSRLDISKRKRKLREQAEQRKLAATLPDGTSPKLRASLMAAHRRRAEDPETKERIARAQTERRVQMAKKEAGITDAAPPKKFFGMDQEQWEQEVNNSLPPSISSLRKQKKAKKP